MLAWAYNRRMELPPYSSPRTGTGPESDPLGATEVLSGCLRLSSRCRFPDLELQCDSRVCLARTSRFVP